MPSGTLIGYYLCCPSCGRLGIYLDTPDARWIESGWASSEWRGVMRSDDSDEEVVVVVEHPATVSHAGFVCQGCGRGVVVRENVISIGEVFK